MSFAKSKANGRQNHREDLVFACAVAGTIFLAVSSTVAITQRRRKSKAKRSRMQTRDLVIFTANQRQLDRGG
jgi:hypothetical protein